uniref:SHSP domain-containing protein n=1 Tax=Oryza punctata TaxID=4537 RepID=A0A0E0KGZ9_ORYPU
MDTRGTSRTFEEYDATVEWSRSAEADAREEIRVLVDNHGHLRTRGERPVAGNRWSRFQNDFQLPADCNVDGIRAKFENETLTITLPKKTPSPVVPSTPSPVTPQPEPRRPPAAPLPGVRTPPSPPRRAPAPPPVPAPARLLPAISQRPPAERRPAPLPEPVTRKRSDLGALMKPKEDKVEETTKPLPPPVAAAAVAEEEEEARVAREARGKMDEDQKKANEEVTDMAQLTRPVSASRRQLVNVAVAAVVLLGITLYVWNTLRNAATGGGGGDHRHGASYSDEM